jgi:hypothetical protein
MRFFDLDRLVTTLKKVGPKYNFLTAHCMPDFFAGLLLADAV